MNPIKPTRPQADPADSWVKTRGHGEPKAPTTRMTFDLDKDKHHAFTVAAAKRGQKLTVVLREFVDAYLAQAEREEQKQ